MEQKVVMRYSEAFKLQVVRQLEEGQFGNPWEAGQAHGVKGTSAVAQVKALRKRVRELERALADAHLDLKLADAYVELACEEAGIQDVAEFLKKHATVRSTGA